jgi:Leucine-rich repeat (LRR) protein
MLSADEYYQAFLMSMSYANGTSLTSVEEQLIQRYVVCTLDVSLSGSGSPLTADGNASECEWLGVVCGKNGTNVTALIWANSSLAGTIPPEVASLPSLTELDLGENAIQGTLPEELFLLSNLELLFLHQNALFGTLSESFSNLTALTKVFLGDNNFTGTFPKAFGSPSVNSYDARPLRKFSIQCVSVSMCLLSRPLLNSRRFFVRYLCCRLFVPF